MTRAYLGLGGNLGDRARFLTQAVARLRTPPELNVAALSSMYETAAVGLAGQPDFLNAVAAVDTTLSPRALLERCLKIEAELGRERRERWGPRTIDLDVLLYGDIQISDTALTLPHPRMGERAFVLVPLVEIAPQIAFGGETAQAKLARLDGSQVRKIGSFADLLEK